MTRTGRHDGQNRGRSIPWRLLAAELVGTGLLIAVGLSIVVLDFSPRSPIVGLIPSSGVRRLITGFLFGTTGAVIAWSPLGRTSGAHINPVVTLAFWVMGKMRSGVALGYVAAQLLGGVLGGFVLLVWGRLGAAADYAVTTPGPGYGWFGALAGELITTLLIILLLLTFVTRRRLRNLTPLLFPLFYAIAVFLEAPISGTSTNPARTLPPELLAWQWNGWWVYWVGPAIGALAAALATRLRIFGVVELEIAKLYHFEHDLARELSHDRARPRRDRRGRFR